MGRDNEAKKKSREMGEEGKELELESLFWIAEIDSHTMEMSGFPWGKKTDSNSQLCNLLIV